MNSVIQGFCNTLARHLQNSEVRNTPQVYPRLIHLERLLKGLFHIMVMLAVTHVDKINDYQSTKVAQPQLASNFLGRLHVGLEGRIFHTPLSACFAGVHINTYQRLCRFDDQRTAGREWYTLFINLVDLFFQLET
jgi:hypothetical protein